MYEASLTLNYGKVIKVTGSKEAVEKLVITWKQDEFVELGDMFPCEKFDTLTYRSDAIQSIKIMKKEG